MTGGYTQTMQLQGAVNVQVGDLVPFMRNDGIPLHAEVVSVDLASGGPVVVLWHDLPLMVEAQTRTFTHADGRECEFNVERFGRPLWCYLVGPTEAMSCRRDHLHPVEGDQ